MKPSAQIYASKNKVNKNYCRCLLNKNILETRKGYKKSSKRGKTVYRKNVIWDYPAVAVTSFDINGNYTCSNYSRTVYQTSYNNILSSKLNSLHPSKKIGDSLNGNLIGHCAEPHAANRTMNQFRKRNHKNLQLDEVFFSMAIRPRTMEVIPYCKNCINTFPSL